MDVENDCVSHELSVESCTAQLIYHLVDGYCISDIVNGVCVELWTQLHVGIKSGVSVDIMVENVLLMRRGC